MQITTLALVEFLVLWHLDSYRRPDIGTGNHLGRLCEAVIDSCERGVLKVVVDT